MTEDREHPAPVDALMAQRREELAAALSDVVEARDQLEDAQLRMEATRDEAHRVIRRFAAALVAADEPTPVDLLRHLYWDYPELHVEPIAKSFGMRHVADVSRLVGSDERELPCRGGCGCTLVRRKRSRSELTGRARPASRDPLRCEACQEAAAREEAHRAAEYAEWRRREDAESEALAAQVQAALEAGHAPSATYVEFPGIPGTWRMRDADER